MTPRATPALLVAGSANLDFVVRARRVPAPGETVLGRAFATYPGGKGANQAVACARAGGVDTRMLVALGDDAFAEPLKRSLREAGVALHIVRARGQPTGIAFICLADDAENAITVAPGANERLCASDLPRLDGIDMLLLQLETPLDAVRAYACAARARGVRVMLNAAPARALPDALLDAVDVLVVNEGELATVSGCDDGIAAALDRLRVPCVVVTLGARGCVARAGSRLHARPAYAIDAVDTTAAGDTFCGALAARLAAGAVLDDALDFAAAASALACTRMGAQASIPRHAEVDAFLATREPPTAAATQALLTYCGFPTSP